MARKRGNRKKREPTSLCLEFALHGKCACGDQCTFGHWDGDNVTRDHYEQLLQNLGKDSDKTLAQAVANVIEARISAFDDDDHDDDEDDDDDDDDDDGASDWDQAMEALELEHQYVLEQERKARAADAAQFAAQTQQSLATHQQTLDHVRAMHASRVAKLNGRIRLLSAGREASLGTCSQM